MEGPGAWVIGVVLQNNVRRVRWGTTLEELGVTALRVFRVGDLAVPCPETLGEHVEVVAVQMHGMRCQELIVDYEANRGVGAEVVDGPFGVRVGEIACIRERQDGVASDGVSRC